MAFTKGKCTWKFYIQVGFLKRSSILPKKRWRGTRWLAGCAPEVIVGPLVHLQLSGFTSNPAKKVARPSNYFCFSFSQFGNLPYLLPYLTLELSQFFAKVCQLGQIYNGGIDFPRDLLLEPTQLTLFIAEKHMFLQHLALLAISHSFVKETERWEILGHFEIHPHFFAPHPPMSIHRSKANSTYMLLLTVDVKFRQLLSRFKRRASIYMNIHGWDQDMVKMENVHRF